MSDAAQPSASMADPQGTVLRFWQRRRSGAARPLSVYLVRFALALVLPILLFTGLVLNRYAELERASSHKRAAEVVQAVAGDVDRDLTAIITTLSVLASAPELSVGDWAGFHRRASGALQGTGLYAVLRDRSGQQLLNTRLPWGTPLPRETLTEVDERVLRTQRVDVSGLFVGAVARRPIYTVTQPVRRDGHVLGFLHMSLELDRLLDVVARGLPESWSGAIVDQQDVVLTQVPDHAQNVGMPMRLDIAAKLLDRQGVFEDTDPGRAHVLRAFTRSEVADWTILAWVPVDVIEAPLRRAWLAFAAFGALLLALSAAMSFAYARRISGPIASLADSARLMSTGAIVPAETTPLEEVNRVSTALAEATREFALRRAGDARLAALVDFSGEAMLGQSRTGVIETWNPAAERLFGFKADEVLGQSSVMLTPPDHLEARRQAFARILAGETVTIETARLHKDGRAIPIELTAAPLRDAAGDIVGAVSIARDISERKEQERHIRFIMGELSHRTKNLMSVILSIARQSGRQSTTVGEFVAAFNGRLQALATSHDMLVHQSWRGASLGGLIRSQLAPFVGDHDGRLHLAGPQFLLSPAVAESLGMALHELATNAVKYGALANSHGRIHVAWQIAGGDGGRRFSMSWRETGGPPAVAPTRTGFGQLVVKGLLEHRTGGTVELRFEEAGLTWHLTAPADQVLADGAVGGAPAA